MNKRLFVLLIILMSLSLIGIIFVQGYWINNTVENNKEQFSFNAKQILISVSNGIQYREFEEMFFPLQGILDSIDEPDNKTIRQLLDISIDNTKSFAYANGILEEDYKLFSSFVNFNIDTVKLKNILNRNVDTAAQDTKSDIVKQNSKSKLERIRGLTDLQRRDYEIVIGEIASFIPIHRRVQKKEIKYLLKKELEERDIKVDFEYAIYSNALATKVRSDDFSLDYPTTYAIPLFVDDEGVSDYQLYVNFTGKKQYVLSTIKGMAILSIIFTLIIVVAYSSALSQLMQQRQISQIKTDFINNMTHELKTPIATINLALDSIKNPKIGGDPEKVQRYMKMIREENKRMHAQVENVLRISQLEKNELNIKKEKQELHDIIEDAVTHVSLIVEDRNGYIKMHLGALKTTILANDSHMTNVIVNILDNAAKYSDKEPKVDIYTENVKNSIILKIRDQGIGMSKVAVKKIFEKFFREHTGDLHNVKGHGLGLTYVKRIIDDHHGQIWVESERGKGSTFIIKLPLIS
ncbi:sensor histidine kinase [Aquimarina sp. AD10]|uniref:histidine kinase n=1 Tax=Aquimarina aggregata TaxID=1642818 RepID=A0A163BUR0_9FLAO|nr:MULTISPECIES: HAMP domain-containing sensor histidine kinase [Aquimarina]AXT63509.1 sensor histidine kinase [Aquimarina sp. AD10]KZS41801.1 histidine kinase [Aquimarina aggregata]RKM99773.1 sensor histidine kinase [Aquimarina sp. AD10]